MDKLTAFLAEIWNTLTAMSPYLLFGFLMAGLLAFFISRRWVEVHLGGHGLWPVLKATLFGIPLPLCSCSVIPVTASLSKHGASRGAATAFLIATPQTSVDSIFVTLSLLGPMFAIFRPLAALISGVFGGLMVHLVEPRGEAKASATDACQDACCATTGRVARLAGALKYGFTVLPRDIGLSLGVGVVIAGAIAAFVPAGSLESVGTGVGAILVMMALGIPIYVCATASIPVAAALILKGVSPGAAFAFLMTGPATNAAGIATVWKLMGPRTALVYLGSVALAALAGGLCLDWLAGDLVVEQMGHAHEMLPESLKVAAAVALLLILAYAYLGERLRRAGSCPHCVEATPEPCEEKED